MKIKIFLHKKNGKVSRFPDFVIDFESDKEAYTAFAQLYKDVNIGNTQFVMCKAVVFSKEKFESAVLC